MLTWLPGRIWDDVNPQNNDLRFSLGNQCGLLTKQLTGFDHSEAHRQFIWDIAQSLWTKEFIHLFKDEEGEIISFFQNHFESSFPSYAQLRKSVVHNDANNHNIIVSDDLIHPQVIAAIDYGDAIHTQIINDVAIAAAYAAMGHEDPLDAILPFVKGYHSSFPLEEDELAHLYGAIAMRLIITATRSAINKIEEPDNEYLLISEKPAWGLLRKWREIGEDFAHFSFRTACGFSGHPNEQKFIDWALSNKFKFSDLFPSVNKNEIYKLDLSVSSKWLGHQKDFDKLDFFQFKINQLQKTIPQKLLSGGYLEPRAVYVTDAYEKIGNNGPESRTIHLGIDIWLPPETAVHALFDSEVVTAVNNSGNKEYGGLLILKHQANDIEFFTLYGHLSIESVQGKKSGDLIKKDTCIGYLGNYPDNGNWAAHLHFQVMLSLLNFKNDFPGVSYYNQLDLWKSICPNPNLLFKSSELQPFNNPENKRLVKFRNQHLGKEMSLQYSEPLNMVRGMGPFLIDQIGRKYLDTVNNVAHVGHEHPQVVKAGQEQMALINTNTRYLHENITILAKELMSTLPESLNVLHFVNSGSEANELAIRMVKAVTGQKDIIASEMGYHGNSNMCIDISSYKFDGKGGSGAPEQTYIFPLPDAFRGKYRGENSGKDYVAEVQNQIDIIHEKGRKVGALIVEPIISCGGQVELPNGFLKGAYEKVRKAGGLCISDEVQTGCGRMGTAFWGFQLHDVEPDIITIGKPLGNGHPLAAVACTQEIADKFANGMEYFNTFGGNPVSCAIGTAVLQVVKTEKLQENAYKIGAYLKKELNKLAKKFPIIGDIRGQGLFLGIELVDAGLQPLPHKAEYLINRMKEHSILMSTDGPGNNVLKIKPPLVFNKQNAKDLIFYLQKILKEDFMKI